MKSNARHSKSVMKHMKVKKRKDVIHILERHHEICPRYKSMIDNVWVSTNISRKCCTNRVAIEQGRFLLWVLKLKASSLHNRQLFEKNSLKWKIEIKVISFLGMGKNFDYLCNRVVFKATSEARSLFVCVWFFSAKTWHPFALVKVSAIFLQAYFSESKIQNFKNRSATECPFWPGNENFPSWRFY